tara:strand:- start:6489 stop:6884 length:396 start_codon:yes stop_codon:yes gene_type:complete
MATLTPKLTLTGTATDFGAALSLSVSTTLTADEPFIGISRITATTTGNESIIVPSVNSAKYVYIKHTGLNSAGSSSGSDKVKVETADGTAILELKSGEFAFFPYFAQGACLLQLETDANTVQVEYAYFTRA